MNKKCKANNQGETSIDMIVLRIIDTDIYFAIYIYALNIRYTNIYINLYS